MTELKKKLILESRGKYTAEELSKEFKVSVKNIEKLWADSPETVVANNNFGSTTTTKRQMTFVDPGGDRGDKIKYPSKRTEAQPREVGTNLVNTRCKTCNRQQIGPAIVFAEAGELCDVCKAKQFR